MKFLFAFLLFNFSLTSFAGDCDYIYEEIFAYEHEPSVEKAQELMEFIRENAYIQLEMYRLQKVAMTRAVYLGTTLKKQYPDYLKNVKAFNVEGKCYVQAVSDLMPGKLNPKISGISAYAKMLDKNDHFKALSPETIEQKAIREESYIIQAQLKVLSFLGEQK